MELNRKDFLKAVVIMGGAHVLGCGSGTDNTGTGGGSAGTGGGTSGAGGGTSAAGGGTSAVGGGSAAAGGGTSAAGGGTSAAGGGTSAAGGGTSAAGGGASGNACTAALVADQVTALGSGNGILSTTHNHHLEVPLADLQAGVDFTLTHGVTGPHTHTFSLTAAEISTLQAGMSVTKSTTNTGTDATTHSHQVKLVC